jgi:hypothetical protein
MRSLPTRSRARRSTCGGGGGGGVNWRQAEGACTLLEGGWQEIPKRQQARERNRVKHAALGTQRKEEVSKDRCTRKVMRKD